MAEDFPTAEIKMLLLAESAESHYATPQGLLAFDFDGITGDQRHRGRTRLADPRLKFFTKKRDLVLNRQTVSLIDDLSLDHIGDEMELDADLIMGHYNEDRQTFLARCLGANIVLGNFRGTANIPTFYDIPNSTDFGPFDPVTDKSSDAALMITRYNPPCIQPGNTIAKHYPLKVDKLAQRFVVAAEQHRGFVAIVAKTGSMALGQTVVFRPLPSAR